MYSETVSSKTSVLLLAVILSGVFMSGTAFAAVSVKMDRINYISGDNLTITGLLVGSTVPASVTATIYNSTNSMAALSATSAGGSQNIFSISTPLNASYPVGDYNVVLSDASSSVNMTFRVIPERINFEPYMVNSGNDIINISTSTEITAWNAMGGNFTEVLNMSKSPVQKIHYGNYSVGGKLYHFVLVDQTNASTYDRLYIDDDKKFQFGNDTEDAVGATSDVEYQAIKKSGVFQNGTGNGDFRFVVGDMEKFTGDEVLLWKPMNRTPANTDNITFVVLAKNDTAMISEPVKIEIFNSAGQNVTSTYYLNTSQEGWLNMSVPNLPAGTYTLKLNDSLASMTFSVEAFKMFATIADTSNNPAYSFSPSSKVRIIVTSKNSTGPFNLASFTVTISSPAGTAMSKAKADFSSSADGLYYYDYGVGSTTGRYGVSVTGSDASGNTQTAFAGFEVQSVGLEAEAVNTRYLDEADSSGATVNAFAPGSNVTIITFLTNITAGGMMAKGPEGFQGLVNPGNCSSAVTLDEIKDENGDSYSVSYQVVNLSMAMSILGASGAEQPPEQMQSQCMIIFRAPNKTGSTYRAGIKMRYGTEDKYAGVMFGVQRIYASGNTVDFKGDKSGFFAPNSTVRIKLDVKDLLTDMPLSAGNITSAKIIGLYQMFPIYKDVLGNSTLRSILNESVVNGTISFTSPLDEGFYSMKFRFTASVGGVTETGIGDAFFMLKKYMVWGQLSGAQQGQWYVKQGQNITLEVNVMDINNAQTVFGGYNSQKSCTGCTGFMVSASQVRNDQQFKTFAEGIDYTVQKGTIINSTNPVANLTIVPGNNMQSGWYSVDVLVTDPATNATYFGWAGFEIRNFWVEAQQAYWNATSGKYSVNAGGPGMQGGTFEVGSPVAFAIMPRDPSNPGQIQDPSSKPTVDSVQSAASFPPVPISGYTSSVDLANVEVCMPGPGGPGGCQTKSMYVVTISNLPNKQADYMANVRVTVGGATDIGTFRFGTSTYDMNTDYRKNSFPPLYSSSEKLIVNFTAFNFTKGPYNITNVTVEELFSQKMGQPVRMKYGQNYSTNCNLTKFEYGKTWQYCQIQVNLTNLAPGEYNARLAVVDGQSAGQKTEEIFFKIQDVIIGIPSIEEGWVWQTDTVSKKIDMDIRDWSQCQEAKATAVPGAYLFCGDYQQQNGGPGPGQPQNFNLTVPNTTTSTKDTFGYIPMSGNNGQWFFGGSVAPKSRMCMYANGSHLWINASAYNAGVCDLRQTMPKALNEMFTDGDGGLWRLDAIGDQSITVTGINTLYDTGALINTSFSRSGIVKFGQLRESDLGAFIPGQNGGSRKGIDLNGDGQTNGTVYFAIADNASYGVYDTFFFSKNSNFTTRMSVNDPNRNNRAFGPSDPKDRLTLLSIDPKGQQVKFYSRQAGDWAHFGDIKLGNNVTIPVIVMSPDGSDRSANVSVTGYKNMRTWQMVQKMLVSNQNITGLGELRFNTSNLSGTGEYSFSLEAGGDKLDEWKWPMATVRGFLVDGDMGEAFYVTPIFKRIPLATAGWQNGMAYIQQDARNASAGIVDGVLSYAHPTNPNGCTFYGNLTPVVGPEAQVLVDDNNGPPYYFFYNTTKLPKQILMNGTACTFNVSAPGQPEGSTLIMNRYGRNFNLTVLKIGFVGDMFGGWRIDFGVAGVNGSILPIKNDTWGDPSFSMQWAYMQNVSIFGTYYDVILANDSTYNYAWCNFQPMQGGECAKRAWFVPTSVGNFSAASVKSALIGENFTSDLYVASMGPQGGAGITVGNFSAMGNEPRPTIGAMPLADNSPVYFAVLNESAGALNYDLNKDGQKSAIYYALATDSDFNGQNNMTALLIDDDTQFMQFDLMQPGSQTGIALDFNSTEIYNINQTGNQTKEQWNSLPSGTSDGNARFASMENFNGNWENSPDWQVPFFNNTHMLLKKSKWQVSQDQPVDIFLKAYNFDMTPKANANVTVTQVARSTYFGFEKLAEGANYSVSYTRNSTDSYGYDLVKVLPASGNWTQANYQVIITVQTSTGNETFERWFNTQPMRFGP